MMHAPRPEHNFWASHCPMSSTMQAWGTYLSPAFLPRRTLICRSEISITVRVEAPTSTFLLRDPDDFLQGGLSLFHFFPAGAAQGGHALGGGPRFDVAGRGACQNHLPQFIVEDEEFVNRLAPAVSGMMAGLASLMLINDGGRAGGRIVLKILEHGRRQHGSFFAARA